MRHLQLQTISGQDAQTEWIPSATLALGLIGPLHALASVIHPAGMPVVVVAQSSGTLCAVTAAYLHFSTKNMAPDSDAFEEFVSRTPLRGHEPLVCFYTAAALTLVAAGVVHYVAAIVALALAGLSLIWVYRHAALGVVKRSASLVANAAARLRPSRNEV
ncbi:hypothetical protein EXIGLDRAFT_830297 [Exidia glandulosa HHB12029]|uniref:Uncharacterized protein n=1 Tax=Exidia glandulosa HHB12029 TaxID=1314781 RepID=A0A165NRM2_EXIGL|nr:hypothetical protein EXIGLDRAFT_830297 [Exidia glandulosa HHB12029]